MKPIRILTMDFNLVDEIDDYESLIFTRRYLKAGDFEIVLHNEFAGSFEEERLIMIDNNPRKVGIVRHIEKATGDSENVIIKGYSLSSIIGRRITVPPTGQAYDRLTNNAETIIKRYVDRNCINPEDPNRIIPNLVIADNLNRGQSFFYQTRYKQLDEELTKVSEMGGLGWEVYLDFDNKQFVFDVYEGRNLSSEQTINPPVIFSVDFDNIANQTYVNSAIGYKNRAYVAGRGEGANREVIEVGDNSTGLDRIETFVDARDIENENDLPSRGVQKLEEFSKIQSFDTQILPYSNFIYEKDWDLGDLVTTQNKDWNVALNVRTSEITEVYEPGNFSLEVTFGRPLPGLIEKLKQEFDQPLIEPEIADSVEWSNVLDKPELVTQEEFDGHLADYEQLKQVRSIYFNYNSIPTDISNDFNVGVTFTIPNVSSNDNTYNVWIDEICSVLDLERASNAPFRTYIETIKYGSTYMIQNVYLYGNTTATSGINFFNLKRTYGFGNEQWRGWQVNTPISQRGSGNPNGTVYGVYGALYFDLDQNFLYVKKGPQNTSSYNSSWEIVGVV